MISEVIVRGKRNIKQNGNWLYFNLAIESSSFILTIFKTEKFKLTLKVETDQFVICFVLPVSLSKYLFFYLILASFVPFQFCNPQPSKIVIEDYLGLATTSLHNMDVYVTPYSSKGFKLFQPFNPFAAKFFPFDE